MRIAFLGFSSLTSKMGMAPTSFAYSTRTLNSNAVIQKCQWKGTGDGGGGAGRRAVASGWCVRSSGSVPSEARGGPGVLLLSSVLGAGASKLGNKQEQQHRSLQRW